MNIGVDTNVLIAAFLTSGTSHEVLEAITSQKSCVLSPYILEEFKRVLTSKKFQFPAQIVDSFVSYLRQHSSIQIEYSDIEIDFSDASDRKILALCHTVAADFLVTGDGELLALKKTGRTIIIQPSDFLKVMEKF